MSVTVTVPGFTPERTTETLWWTGEIATCSFALAVPRDASAGAHVGRAEVHVSGLRVVTLLFQIDVAAVVNPTPIDVTSQVSRLRTAFASYATEDRQTVLGRIQGMLSVMTDLDVFFDVMSLRSGERWMERLRQEIESRDAFLPFLVAGGEPFGMGAARVAIGSRMSWARSHQSGSVGLARDRASSGRTRLIAFQLLDAVRVVVPRADCALLDANDHRLADLAQGKPIAFCAQRGFGALDGHVSYVCNPRCRPRTKCPRARRHTRWRCEPRQHPEPYGVEAQFYRNEVFHTERSIGR
jgi:hypothetical protein